MEEMLEKFAPMAEKGKPGLILEQWIQAMGLEKSEAMGKLLTTSFLYRNMKEFLEAMTFGTEGDLHRPGKKQYRSDAVTLMTLHASKGLEFSAVILCGVRKGVIPLEWGRKGAEGKEELTEDGAKAQNCSGAKKQALPGTREQELAGLKEQELQEERRLFYVGMTRARDQLILVTGKEPSQFLEDIPENCLNREMSGGQRAKEGRQLSLFDWIS